MSTQHEDLCRDVEDSLADILEGLAPSKLVEHIADCDRCRDLRYEAERAAELASAAGADFQPTEGFPDRMLGLVLEARPEGPQAAGSLLPAGPRSVVIPATSSETASSAARANDAAPQGAEAIVAAKTEFANVDPRTADNNATVFEPNMTFEPEPATKPTEGRAAAAPAVISDPYAPVHKTVPLSAVINPTPLPRSAEAERPVDAVTGGSNTGPVGPHAGVVTRPSAEAQSHAAVRSAEARVPDLEVGGPPRPATAGGGSTKVVSLFRRKGFLAAAVGGMAAAAAFGAYLVKDANDESKEQTAFTEGAWGGTVTALTRASATDDGGLEVCKDGCKLVAQGATIEPGSTLRTDAKTRARIKLADESWIAIDRNTEVVLPAGSSRQAKVERGLVVADVKEVQGAQPAKLVLPQGDVTVLGTKVAVTVTERRAAVEVVRGAVDVTSAAGTSAKVRAGEEATIEGRGEPIVTPSSSLSETVEWTDGASGEDASLRGLGELRAKKPGEQQERAKAVRLSKHSVKVRVVDVVARTEVDETFTNETDEELEGIFRFPLPPDAQIEKLSLEVDGQLLDGAFVDRDRGAAIWRGVIQNAAPKAPRPREEIIWVAGPWRDPALLEWQRGGRFELRIFPIPKKGSRRVVLTYTQVVEQSGGVRRFTYPLAHDASGSTKIDDFSVDVQVLGHDKDFGLEARGYQLAKADATSDGERLTISEKNFVPAGDLTVEYALPNRKTELTAWAYEMPASASPAAVTNPASTGSGADKLDKSGKVGGAKTAAERAKQAEIEAKSLSDDGSPFVALAVRPKLPRFPEGKERLHVVVVDSSRSMVGERFTRARQLASSIVREMDRRDSFMLLACDTTCQAMGATAGRTIPAPSTPSAEAAQEVERFLGSIDPEGGSNLLAAVQAARTAAGGASGKELRIIYLGDGTPTVGPTKASTLESAIRHALPAGGGSVVAVALGADADTTTLSAMARAGNGVVVPYVPGQRTAAAAIDVLASAYGSVLSDVEVVLPAGLTEVTPKRLDPIPAGGEAFVFARMTGGKQVTGNVVVRGRVGTERFEQTYPASITSSTSAGNAFVPRLFAAAKIGDLEQAGLADDRERIVALSKRFNVASRHTSMIVLESEAMFKAFGLDKNGIATTFTGDVGATSTSADAEGEADEESERKDDGLSKDAKGKSANRGSAGFDGDFADPPAEPQAEASGPGGGGRLGLGGVAQPTTPPAATAVPKPAPAPPPSKKESARPADDPFSPSWDKTPARRPRPPANFVPMRRVFDRKASFSAENLLAKEVASALAEAEAAHKAAPDSRDKTVALYKALMAAGRIGEAQDLTAKWSERDALDPDALLARADLAAMSGDRTRAMRILSGLSDVRPGDKNVQRRLASAFTQLGAPDLACQHRLALADIDATDVNALAAAARCSQDLGFSDLSRTILTSAPSDAKDRVETTSRTLKLNEIPALLGDVRVTATWSTPADLDLAVVDKNGRRFSWIGSTSQTVGVTAKDAASLSTETLAVSGLGSGNFVVEVVRASNDRAAGPITGELTFTLPGGETRKVPFTLTGQRAEVGSMRVFFTSRLVPVESFGGGWRGSPSTF